MTTVPEKTPIRVDDIVEGDDIVIFAPVRGGENIRVAVKSVTREEIPLGSTTMSPPLVAHYRFETNKGAFEYYQYSSGNVLGGMQFFRISQE